MLGAAATGLVLAACSSSEQREDDDTFWIDATASQGWGVRITAGGNDAGEWHGRFDAAGLGDAIKFNVAHTGTAGVDAAFTGTLKLPYGWSSTTKISGKETSPDRWEGEVDPKGWGNSMKWHVEKKSDGSYEGKIRQNGLFDDIATKDFKVKADGKFRAKFDPAGWGNSISINGSIDPSSPIPVGVQVAMMAAIQAKEADDDRNDDKSKG